MPLYAPGRIFAHSLCGSPRDGFSHIRGKRFAKNYAQGKLVSSKKIQYYDGKKISEGFWACHIWDRLEDGTLTNKDNSLFSFIPNIVWLPKELSRLTDHVPIIKDVMKQLSIQLYGQLKMPNQALQ